MESHNMHKSYFMWLQPGEVQVQELSLSNEVSEWLFHVGYWRHISSEHTLQYEQYEEEVMPRAKIPSAIEKLNSVAQEVCGSEAAPVRFTYGWDANRQPLECITTSEVISVELARLREFFEGAQASGLDLYCQL